MSETQQVAAPQLTAAQLIDAFIKLRDRKKQIKERHTAELAPINELMEQLDGMMLAMCQQTGADALRVKGVGSATVGVKTTASISEPEKFQQFVIANERWDMVNWHANVEACQGFVDDCGLLPDGVTLHSFQHMNVRRAPKSEV